MSSIVPFTRVPLAAPACPLGSEAAHHAMVDAASESSRSLRRGLRLLQEMNRNPHASVTRLARETGIPRSTAYRLLDTLAEMGFVSTISGRYLLAREVRSLSDGFIDQSWICPAWKEMVRLGGELVWPICLSTMESSTLVIRRTTHELSPMSIDYGMSGKRLPMTETAAGRVYLAFCPEAERRLILSMENRRCDSSRIDRDILEHRLQLIRERGYDTRIGGFVAKTGSLAVPVIVEGQVLCCLAVIFIASALTIARAVEQFEGPMKQAARTIADAATHRTDP